MTTLLHPLEKAVADALPRVLSLMDRAAFSPTRGSADRAFWHYRIDKDYPSATFAQVSWPLALLATSAAPVDERLQPRLAELALSAMGFWAKVAHADGSCDEWFPNERSHVATAFTAFAVAEAALALSDRFRSWEERGRVIDGLIKARAWLGRHRDVRVANHAAGALAALTSIATLAGEDGGPSIAREEQALLSLQDPEGFFPEYGGADPGYASVTLAFLAFAERRRPSAALETAIGRLLAFLLPFCNPDGSFSGEHGRRATRYAFISGPALLAHRNADAAFLCHALLQGLARRTLAPPSAYDDRYLCFFAFPDAVAALAALSGTEHGGGSLDSAPFDFAQGRRGMQAPAPPDAALFPRAGLAILRRGRLHLAAGMRVGGVLKVFDLEGPPRLLYDDCGYAGRLHTGALVTSWRFPTDARVGAAELLSDGPFAYWTRESPIARHPVAFRVFSRTVGKVPRAADAVARRAKARFTAAPREAPLSLHREVRMSADRIVVIDRLSLHARARVEELRRVAAFAPVHVPSAPLWLPAFEPRLPALGPDVAALLPARGALEVETRIERGATARLTVRAAGRVLQEATLEREA